MKKNNKSIHETWKFIYDNPLYASELIKYKNGFYLNLDTNTKYSFDIGIKHIVGIKYESDVYNMWWLENS
tara:strand:+ start:503 stop:712 length:210 start_codon:yes stop_codon:yes gene_type:complete